MKDVKFITASCKHGVTVDTFGMKSDMIPANPPYSPRQLVFFVEMVEFLSKQAEAGNSISFSKNGMAMRRDCFACKRERQEQEVSDE